MDNQTSTYFPPVKQEKLEKLVNEILTSGGLKKHTFKDLFEQGKLQLFDIVDLVTYSKYTKRFSLTKLGTVRFGIFEFPNYEIRFVQ